MIGTKICTKCKLEKELSEFGLARTKKSGYKCACRDCLNKAYREYCKRNPEKKKESTNSYAVKNRDKINKRNNERYYADKEHHKKIQDKYKESNRTEILKRKAKYRRENRDRINAKMRIYCLGYKDKNNARAARRRATKLQATPHWSEKEKIELVYRKAKELEKVTGLKYHVDHIIPLNSKDVCGLHVWHNLQILEDKINIIKSNNFKGEQICLR